MSKTLYYLFDPLCGWCYAALPALTGLEAAHVEPAHQPSFRPALHRELSPVGAGGSPTTIRQRTGQPRADGSGADQPCARMAALKAIQHARFIDGRNVTDLPTLDSILTATGLTEAAGARAQPDKALLGAHRLRVDQARSMMNELHAQGVPTFIGVSPAKRWQVQTNSIYAEPNS